MTGWKVVRMCGGRVRGCAPWAFRRTRTGFVLDGLGLGFFRTGASS